MSNTRLLTRSRHVAVYYGVPDSGKSWLSRKEAGQGYYTKDPCTRWWDGYRGQRAVVFDEYEGDIPLQLLLRWFDDYPVQVETKGGWVDLKATHIWIPTNHPPESWYRDAPAIRMAALLRRVTIREFNVALERGPGGKHDVLNPPESRDDEWGRFRHGGEAGLLVQDADL